MTKPTLSQLRRLVGNPQAFAVQQSNGSYLPIREPVSDAVLQSHLDLKRTIGTYIGHSLMDGVSVARTLVFDIDDGSEYDAHLLVSVLAKLGIPDTFTGIEFSGRKGYHVWVVLQEYQLNAELRRVGRAACTLADWHGEVFPKQDNVKDLGNLVKLPGGIHQVSGKTNDFIGQVPRPLPTPKWSEVLDGLPPELRARRAASESRFPCLTAIQEEGVQEGGRNNQLFHLAAMLRRAGVSDANVALIVRNTNDLGGDPLEDHEIEGLLTREGGPLCSSIPEDRKCGELCILERTAGLYTRPGQLRYAAEGESVVVTVANRNGKIVEFFHDDIGDDGKMKAVLHER